VPWQLPLRIPTSIWNARPSCRSAQHALKQARNELGTPGGAKVFWEVPKFFKLCPIVLNSAQHIFPGGDEKFSRGSSPPLVTGLLWTLVKNALCVRLEDHCLRSQVPHTLQGESYSSLWTLVITLLRYAWRRTAITENLQSRCNCSGKVTDSMPRKLAA